MLLGEMLAVTERMAPAGLAQDWDNSGLQVGDETASVQRILVALEVTQAVLQEAVSERCDTILTHHPLLFAPVHSLVEARPREKLLRQLVTHSVSVVACHTNLDAAKGGLAQIAGEALGLQDMEPLESASAGWYKLVVYVPTESVDQVAAAVFGAGAGGVGDYSDCAFAVEGEGWFTPGEGSNPVVGRAGVPERTTEVRWETVVPRTRLGAVLRAVVAAHPYEEPAFDVYPVEDLLPNVGIGRVGVLGRKCSVRALASQAAKSFGLSRVSWSGDGERMVEDIAVVPGSGRGSVKAAVGRCDVLITGDLSYHDAEAAGDGGLALVDVPHGEMEWWAFQRWSEGLGRHLEETGVTLRVSSEWRSPWSVVEGGGSDVK